jgi:DNA-binding CsgD family transcriptional regulator
MRAAAFRFFASAPTYSRPGDLLDELRVIGQKHPQRLGVVGAWALPWRSFRIDEQRVNRTVFFHPAFRGEEFWAEYCRLVGELGTSALDDYARGVSHPFTLTEAMRVLRLNGPSRWVFDLLRDYHVRDGLYCPFRRWIVFYSSEQPLHLERVERYILNMAAGIAVEQMERMVGKARGLDPPKLLTEREITILRLRSYGKKNGEIGTALEISPVTVRNHLTKATKKLKARDMAHAIAMALREGLLT